MYRETLTPIKAFTSNVSLKVKSTSAIEKWFTENMSFLSNLPAFQLSSLRSNDRFTAWSKTAIVRWSNGMSRLTGHLHNVYESTVGISPASLWHLSSVITLNDIFLLWIYADCHMVCSNDPELIVRYRTEHYYAPLPYRTGSCVIL